MRRITTFCLTLCLGVLALWGQSSVYNTFSWTPISSAEYIATDLKGNKHDIQQLLRQGKKILIDFSAVWCGPCWAIHTNGYLEALDKEFGPNGRQSQDLIILWVEAQGAPENKIRANDRNWTLISGTQEEVPYPVISDKRLMAALGIRLEGYPTVAFISPGGEYANIYGKGTIRNIALMRELLKSCPAPKERPIPPTASTPKAIKFAYTGEEIDWLPDYRSDSPITSFAWEFEGARTVTSSKERPVVVWDNPGNYKVTFTITNKYGTATSETEFKVYDGNRTDFPVKIDMEDGNFPSRWRTLRKDGDNYTWTNTKRELERLGITVGENFGYGYKSKNSLVSWSFYPTKATPSGTDENQFTFEGIELYPNNWLISPAINIPNDDDIEPKLTFAVNSFFSTKNKKDKYRVYAAIGATIKTSDFLFLLQDGYGSEKDQGWRVESIDLSRFKGQRISLAFVHKTLREGPGIMLDDIEISLNKKVAINAPEAENVKVYPTVADQNITVECTEGASIVLFDIQGRQIFRQEKAESIVEITTNELSPGNYFVRVTEQEGATKLVPIIVQH